MSDACLVTLIKNWSKSLDKASSFCAACDIADYLGVTIPENYDDVNRVLVYVDSHYPDAYIEATESCRDFYNIV